MFKRIIVSKVAVGKAYTVSGITYDGLIFTRTIFAKSAAEAQEKIVREFRNVLH